MGFNPPVPQQDSNWEIRVALLLSLLLQIFLIFLGPMRKRSASPITHFLIWSCYLLADWVADLGLGLILNNMGNIGGGGGGNFTDSSSPIIFAFWAPFILLHLGGPDTITAYSQEDNELWLRHLVGLLFELFSAIVVILCSGRHNRLILATTLMMVVGLIKYGERTYSLYCGSIERFRSNAAGSPDPGPNYAKLMTVFDSKEKAGQVVEIDIANGEAQEALNEMEKQETIRLVMDSSKSVEVLAYEFALTFRRLFVNMIMGFKERRLSQAFFLEHPDMTASEAFKVIEVELNFIYDMVYTKAPVAYNSRGWGWVLRFVCSCCLVSALVIFVFLDKKSILRIDVGITYALLLGAVALDVVALAMLLSSDHAAVVLQTYRRRGRWHLRWLEWLTQAVIRRWWRPRRWSQTTSQFNLVNYCLGMPDHYSVRLWYRLAKVLRVEGILEDLIFIRRVTLNKRDKNKLCRWLRRFGTCFRENLIKPLVPKCCSKPGIHDEDDVTEESNLLDIIFDGLKGSAKVLHDKDQIMELCSRRGKGVVHRLAKDIKEMLLNSNDGDAKFHLIMDSVTKKDFDESLLLWHIATDLCRHKDKPGALTKDTPWFRAVAETLSEYMVYLLVKQPEMESARTSIWLLRYQDSCAEARRFFGSVAAWSSELDHDNARRLLLSVNTTRKPSEVKGDRSKSVLFDSVILAKALLELDEALMWELVAGVWREMLIYMAGKCQGTTHVRLLSRGGELITLVWFLMVHMGLGDLYQIQEGDAKAKLIVHDQ